MMILLSLIIVLYRLNSHLLLNDGITCSASSHLFFLSYPVVCLSPQWSREHPEVRPCIAMAFPLKSVFAHFADEKLPLQRGAFASVLSLLHGYGFLLGFPSSCQHVWSSDLALSHLSPFSFAYLLAVIRSGGPTWCREKSSEGLQSLVEQPCSHAAVWDSAKAG